MERVEHRGKPITVTINGKEYQGNFGDTILDIARANDIYIPTMCYLTKISPITSCRMCVVDVEGVDGFVLSCQEKAVDGAKIVTDNSELYKERQNIMKFYNVNHPLQCGVCDKSGECHLQNKTLEFNVSSQEFSAVEQLRKNKKWGIIGYDPYLCIMCERCVHTCNEIVGTDSLYIRPGGYKSVIDMKFSNCIQCGECISVCPVGALVSNDYKYKQNAWESQKIPATCGQCSSGCSLDYEVKGDRITRVTNEIEFNSLCGNGRFNFNFENRNGDKDISSLNKAVDNFKRAKAIRFNSDITNEEALILQKISQKYGLKLINEDGLNLQKFMRGYGSIKGENLYNGTLDSVSNSDFIITIGSKVTVDNPMVRFKINQASKNNRAEVVYMHPIEDETIQNIYTKFIKYEAGSEEGVMALLASYFVNENSYLDDLDIGYLSAESNVSEEELEDIVKRTVRKKRKTIIIGEDILTHQKSENIAKLVALLEVYGGFETLVIPAKINSLGVSLICDLDNSEENSKDFTIGYNSYGDFILSNDGNGDFNIPALNQQEGTFTTINKEIVPTNVALEFNGYCLNDIANRLDIDNKKEYTVDYTKELPLDKGFKNLEFDNLDNFYDNQGVEYRGYKLNSIKSKINLDSIDEVEDLNTYDGTVIYRCEVINSFNEKQKLIGSHSFATVAKIHNGDKVIINFNGEKSERIFKLDSKLKGNIAICNTFETALSDDLVSSNYRYKQVKIERVVS